MSTTPTPEAPSPELLRMHNAGQLLANCAFNIAQHAGEPVSESVAATLKQCQSEWDAACLAFKAARAALTQGAGEAVEPVAWPRDAAEVRQFMNSNCEMVEFAVDEATPDDGDRYQLTAHDFLSAVNWWADFPHHPSEEVAQQLQQAVARAIEECAVIVDRYAMALDDGNNPYLRSRECQQAAAAIRAKGQQ